MGDGVSIKWIAGVDRLPPQGVYPAGVGQIRAGQAGRSVLRTAVGRVRSTSDNARYDDDGRSGRVRRRSCKSGADAIGLQMQSACACILIRIKIVLCA